MIPQTDPAYRPDIDGLRAIAVLSVVLYHFGVPGHGGGFTGVDIFFVISGFLIGGLLWREAEQTGRIRLAPFFARRIKRLAPAFVVMALACATIGYLFLLPFEYRGFAKSLIAATVYLSNVHFFREAGYFDTGAEDKVLLHTWSLAVEEQFYIVLPLIMLVLTRWMGLLRAILWAAFVLSLATSLWMLPRSQPAAFYLFPFRAWELLAGVLLAVEAHRRNFSFQLPAPVTWAGFALTVAAIVTVPSGNTFPGLWAILPVMGATLLIAAGRSDNILNTALRHKAITAVGLISYSLYLWHWPVVTFAHYLRGNLISGPETFALIALSFALAYISWRFVELPVRKASLGTLKTLASGAIASIALIVVAGVIFIKDGMIDRFDAPLRTHIEASGDFLQDWSRCTTPDEGPFKGVETCPIGPEGNPRVLIWGDSHVRALKEGLDQAAHESKTPALLIWRAGCAPVFGLNKTETAATTSQNQACTSANQTIEKALQETSFDKILLVGRWPYYLTGGGTGLDANNHITLSVRDTQGSQGEQFLNGLQSTIDALSDADTEVFLLTPIPEIANYDSRTIARALSTKRMSAEEARLAQSIALQDVQSRQSSFDTLQASNATLLDASPYLCDDAECSAIFDGTGQYFDNNHLTNSAARRIRNVFRPVLGTPQQ